MWGSYFFVSDELVSHSRTVEGYVSVMSNFGGLIEFLLLPLIAIMHSLNNKNLLTKSIRNLYFETESQKNLKLRSLRFTWRDKLGCLPKPLRICCRDKSLRLLKKGESRVKEDLSIYRIIEAIYKMKASISVLTN